MQLKSNDMLLNVMENPSFSIADFQDIGLDVTNTSLLSKDVYQNTSLIQNNTMFQDNNGNFDQNKFNTVYGVAAKVYNTMAQQLISKDLDTFKTLYSKYDLFAPENLVNFAPSFNINTQEINPDRTTYSTVRVGQLGERTKTPQEIAQSQKVYNPATGEWEDSPEDSFFGNFKDVRALAQYDKDVDINGKERGELGFDENNIEHSAGELKINPVTGTYYYEDLNGRNIHGRQLLHISDVLTNEDSPINAIDFLDSDDIHKSPVGAFLKNTALVGSMFLPYVGPVVTAATILQQAASFGATLGKIATSSDNKFFNYVQGMAEATNPMNTRSEYSQQDMWTMENLFGMVGDTVALLKLQRMLFEQLPRLIGYDGKVLSAEGQAKLLDKFLTKYNAKNAEAILTKFKMPVKQLAQENTTEYLNAMEQLRLKNTNLAALDLLNYMKDYYNVGGVLSKAYMTLLTVNDIYDEAKTAGASDNLAALTTLGYAAAEYGLLSTGLGEWILPELRAARMLNKAVLKALTKDTIKAFEVDSAKAITPQAKHQLWSKAINLGKKLFTADYAVGKQATVGKTIASTGAAALGEGTEEVSEDVLLDFIRTMYNMYSSATGSSSRMHNENWKDQYLMDFLGGTLGGGIANVTTNFKTAKATNDMTTEQAALLLVYMTRNPEQLTLFEKMLDKTEIGNKYLSATKTVKDDNGNIIGYEQGTEDDNLDKAIKDLVRQNLSLIKNTLLVDGADIDDKSLFDANTLKDLRWLYLYNSTSTAKLIQNFNTLTTLALKLHNDINNISKELPDLKYKLDSPEYDNIQKRLTSKQEELKKILEQINDITSGKKAALYMAPALLETTPYVLLGFDKAATFLGFAELRTGKEFKNISDDELNTLRNLYLNYTNDSKKDDIDLATKLYLYATRLFSKNLNQFTELYERLAKDKKLQTDLDSYIQIGNALNSVESEEDWVNLAQNILNTISSLVEENDPLKDEFLLLDKALLKYQLTGVISADGSITDVVNNGVKEDSSISEEAYARRIFDVLLNKLIDSILTQVDDLKKIGSVPAPVKYELSNYIDSVNTLVNKYINNVNENTVDFVTYAPKISDETLTNLNTLQKSLNQAKTDLNELPYTPIMDILDSYNSAINGKPLSVSKTFEDLQSLEHQNSKDLSQFLLPLDLLRNVNQTLVVLDLLESIIGGARTDDASLTLMDSSTLKPKDNIWGINKTLNDVAKLSQDKEWEELPTILGATADAISTDIQVLKNKLNYYKTLYGINKGLKLNTQNRVSLHTAYLNYRKVKALSDIVPDDWDKSDLETLLPTLHTLENNYLNDNLSLDTSESIKVRQESIQLEDAIFDFFQKNKDKDLSELFNEKSFKIFTNEVTLLNETTTDIDLSSFVGWLAAKATIKTSVFLKSIQKILPNTKLVPLDPQLNAVQLNVANIINGDTISKFSKAARKAAMDYFLNLSVADRFDFVKNTLKLSDEVAAVLSVESGKKLINTITPYINLYNNTTFIEGAAGAGKSSAVLKLTSEFLKTYYPNTLQNAWVINTSQDNATATLKLLGIEGKDIAFDKKGLLHKISSDYIEPEIDTKTGYITNYKNRLKYQEGIGIASNFSLNQNISNLPKVIFVDEVSRFTQDELLLLDKFAENNGISVITVGDLYQSQTIYAISLNELIPPTTVSKILNEITQSNLVSKLVSLKDITILFGINRNNILHTPKLGTSIRTVNTLLDLNLTTMASILNSIEKDSKFSTNLTLHYWEDNTNIHGTKVMSNASIKPIIATIDKLLANLKDGEKIGYVYYSTDTLLYKELTSQPKYSDKIQLYPGNSAQGLEGKYWILEPNVNNVLPTELLLNINTAITRASVGSILVIPEDFSTNQITGITGIKDENTLELKFSDSDKKRYTDRYLNVLNLALDSFTNEELPTYAERSVNNSQPTSLRTLGPTPPAPLGPQGPPTPPQGPPTPPQGPLGPTPPAPLGPSFDEWFNQYKALADSDILRANISQLTDILNLLNHYIDLLANIPKSELDKITAVQKTINTLLETLNKKLKQISIDSAKSLNQSLDIKWDDLIQTGNIDINEDSITITFKTPQLVNPIWLNRISHNYNDTYSSDKILNISYNTNTGEVQIEVNKSSEKIITNIDNINDVLFTDFLSKITNIQQAPTNQELSTLELEIQSIVNGEDTDNNNDAIILKVEDNLNLPNESSITHDTFLLDSTKTFEIGDWSLDENGNLVPPTLEVNSYRIDGFNGFLNRDGSLKLLNIPTLLGALGIDLYNGLIELIGKLRGYAFNISNKTTLINLIAIILGLSKSDTYVTFGIKNSEYIGTYGREGDFNRFDKSPSTEVLFSNNSENVFSGRNLVMIIGSNNKDLIEIPLLKLNSPQSKLLSMDEYRDIYTSIRNNNSDDRSALLEFLHTAPNIDKHPDLKNWIIIYTNTNNTRSIFYNYDKEWTPANSLHNLGPQYNVNRGSNYLDRTDIVQRTTLTPIQDMLRPDLHVSSVLNYINNNGYYTMENGDIILLISNPGHLFVLYSSNPNLDTDEKLVEAYINQKIAKSKNLEYSPDVHIKYVSTPEIDIDEYVDSIIDFTINKGAKNGNFVLGNIKTPYLVLKNIFLDKNNNPINRDELISLFGKTYTQELANLCYDFILKTLLDLNTLDLSALITQLKSTVNWNDSVLPPGFVYKNKPLATLLVTIIKLMVAPAVLDTTTQSIDWISHINEESKLLFEQLFNNSGLKIYFLSKLQNSNVANVGNSLFKRILVDSNNKYQILYNGPIQLKNRAFTIYGELGTNMYITDDTYSEWLNDIVTNKLKSNNITWYSTDNKHYLDGNSNIFNSDTTPYWSLSTAAMLTYLYEICPYLTSLKLSPTSINQSLSDSDMINIYNAVQSHGETLISVNDTLFIPIKFPAKNILYVMFYLNGEETTNLTVGNEIEFNFDALGSDGNMYTIYYNRATRLLRVVPKQTPKSQPLSQPSTEIQLSSQVELTPENIEAFKLLLSIFTGIIKPIPVVNKLITNINNSATTDIADTNKLLLSKIKLFKTYIVNCINNADSIVGGFIQDGKYNVSNILEGVDEKYLNTCKQLLSSILNYNEEHSCTIGI